MSLNIEPAEEGKGPSVCVCVCPRLLLACVTAHTHGGCTVLVLPVYLRADGDTHSEVKGNMQGDALFISGGCV